MTPKEKKPKSRRARAIYNTIDPRGDVPDDYMDAAGMEAAIRYKMAFGDVDELEYELGNDLPSRVSDAAWRKRLGYDYNDSLLIPNGNAVRLPVDIEREIPTDTTMLKNRIAAIDKLMQYSNKYRRNKYVKLAKRVDQEALDALRKTYKTGERVKLNEHSFNSRQWVKDGNIDAGMSPLNVLKNYTVWYDPKNDVMNYSDIYDFNKYDWAIPGQPFDIKGSIKLNPRK